MAVSSRTGITVLRKAAETICRIVTRYNTVVTASDQIPDTVKAAVLALVAACIATGFGKDPAP